MKIRERVNKLPNLTTNIGYKLRERAEKGTPLQIKRSYLGWIFIAISIGILIAGGIVYIQQKG